MKRQNLVRTLFAGLFVLTLVSVGAAPALAGDAPACAPASTATPSSGDGFQEVTADAIAGPSAEGSPTCDEGSTEAAQDSLCTSGLQGHCEDGTCQPSPASGCAASTLCGGGPASAIDCDGTTYCNQASGCWVHCDGQTTWCPDADRNTCPAVH